MLNKDTRTLHGENEVFALRDGEYASIMEQRPTHGRWFAVMGRSAERPDGEKEPLRQSDGAPVEDVAILAAQVNRDGKWQWMQLSPVTKENVGDLLFDCAAQKDRWYYVQVSPSKDNCVPEYEAVAKKFRDQMRGTEDGKPEATRAALEQVARMLDAYGPECFPANHLGQVDFARAMMESAADEIRAFLQANPPKEEKPA